MIEKQRDNNFYALSSNRLLADVLLIDAASGVSLCLNGDINIKVRLEGELLSMTFERRNYSLREHSDLRDAAFRRMLELEGRKDEASLSERPSKPE